MSRGASRRVPAGYPGRSAQAEREQKAVDEQEPCGASEQGIERAALGTAHGALERDRQRKRDERQQRTRFRSADEDQRSRYGVSQREQGPVFGEGASSAEAHGARS